MLPFLSNLFVDAEVNEAAVARLNGMPDVAEQLVRLLDGDRRLDAPRTLNAGGNLMLPVSDEMRQRSWIVAGLIARDMAARDGKEGLMPREMETFCVAMSNLSPARSAALAIRAEHRPELIALRDWLPVLQDRIHMWFGGPCLVDGILDNWLGVHVLRQLGRPLLRRLEQTWHPALDHHVPRTTPMGPWVLISESWHKLACRTLPVRLIQRYRFGHTTF